MIIPSIDLQGGRCVQLVGGERLAVDAGPPLPIAERFARVGEIAVIDLDAARRDPDALASDITSPNQPLIEDLIRRFPCRVGGGIRDAKTARRWLDLGARRVILGTAATPDLLAELPRDRVIAALDARDGEIVDAGWRRNTGRRVEERIAELSPYVGGFLCTFVEREGRCQGTDMARARLLAGLAGESRLCIAGGVSTAEEIGALDEAGVDAQVGMALYEGRLSLADSVLACLRGRSPGDLVPTIVCDETGVALGLVWSNDKSLRAALEEGRGIYWSRSRQELWRKGQTSGSTQVLLDARLDCDRDALRFRVRQQGSGFCHAGTRNCFADVESLDLGALERRIDRSVEGGESSSYTLRLVENPELLAAKLREETDELIEAQGPTPAAAEAADLLYFTLVALRARGGRLSDVLSELERRAGRTQRRPGNAKPAYLESREQ